MAATTRQTKDLGVRRLLSRLSRWYCLIGVFCLTAIGTAFTLMLNYSEPNDLLQLKLHITRATTPSDNQLRRSLEEIVCNSRHWSINRTQIAELRNSLARHMNNRQPFLTQENTPIGRKYFNTYLQLPMQIDKSKRTLLPETSPFAYNAGVKTCAVVGNGGILKNSGCGNDIDRSELVFRTNLPILSGFADDAGRRSNLTSISPSTVSLQKVNKHGDFNKSRALSVFTEYNGYLVWVPNSWWVSHNMAFKVSELVHKNTKLKLLLSDPEYSRKFGDFWQFGRQILSSGMTMISIALSVCEEIHAYGFWPFPVNSEGDALPMHYAEDLSWSTYNNTHDYRTEFDLLTKLHHQGVLKLHIEKCSD